MTNKASGRSALILAAGFLVFASPAMATDGDDSSAAATSDSQAAAVTRHRSFRHAWHHREHYAHRRPHAVAKADDDDKAAAPVVATSDNKVLATIPPQVANANAQMLLAGAQLSAATVIPPGTDVPAKRFETADADNASANKETVVAASDQLSDADRTLQESNSAAPATTAPPAAPAPAPAATMTGESSAWDHTSLIGKVFIGFGALLTMASAARMFIG
ncbi:hypothetical protein [Bradyrhizobium sp.]|uniref:hypothetical protein n=1 Tax=Bradyrhizobium sp. TaxID=376 RepID=UPI002D544349|nr:hypothetical protein [Bradyrhizobium sp.]HZR75789.1 hypothetical protein [Bradyrhizobium sp.]